MSKRKKYKVKASSIQNSHIDMEDFLLYLKQRMSISFLFIDVRPNKYMIFCLMVLCQTFISVPNLVLLNNLPFLVQTSTIRLKLLVISTVRRFFVFISIDLNFRIYLLIVPVFLILYNIFDQELGVLFI